MVPEKMTVTAGARQFLETVTVVDPNFFQVIRLPLIAGNPARALEQPESIVLSQSEARKYFGDENPVGKVLSVSGVFPGACKASDSACFSAVHTLTVTGVLRDLPHDTQLVADFVVPNTSRADELPQAYKYGQRRGPGRGAIRLHRVAQWSPARHGARGTKADTRPIRRCREKFRRESDRKPAGHYCLTPFRDVHLTSDRYLGMKPGGSWTTIYGFAAVAFLIVLVACCNFMNLATARATLRAREVALRKVAGAKRRQLITQFLGETVLTALVSLAIALSVAEVLLPVYDRFLGEPIAFHYLGSCRLWRRRRRSDRGRGAERPLPGAGSLGISARLGPKSGASGQSGSALLRSILVVCQFAVSIGLGIAVIVVFRQISFARALNLGYDRYVIAWPIAYCRLRHWLDGYAYRVTLSLLYFLAAGAAALAIAWATVYVNTLRLARTSPVHALRYDRSSMLGHYLRMRSAESYGTSCTLSSTSSVWPWRWRARFSSCCSCGKLSWDRWIPDTAHLYRLELTAHPPGGLLFKTAEVRSRCYGPWESRSRRCVR